MTLFGRYEQRDLLGRGGFASVYRGWDPLARREVAIKVLSLHWADEHQEEEMRRRFLAEAQALAGLSHPNIVSLYDLGETPERPYFVMELVRGRTLAALLTDAARLDPDRMVTFAESVASALDLIHDSGKVHRDVKAANIMVTDTGRVVLMDFGIARDMAGPSLTLTGTILLSAESASPEQCRGLRVGPASDIYSLGVVTYQMLAGRPPFLGDTLTLLHAHQHEPPPPLWELRPGLPGPMYAVIAEALAKDPARRPHSAGAFAAELRKAVHRLDEAERSDQDEKTRKVERPSPIRLLAPDQASHQASAPPGSAGETAVAATGEDDRRNATYPATPSVWARTAEGRGTPASGAPLSLPDPAPAPRATSGEQDERQADPVFGSARGWPARLRTRPGVVLLCAAVVILGAVLPWYDLGYKAPPDRFGSGAELPVVPVRGYQAMGLQQAIVYRLTGAEVHWLSEPGTSGFFITKDGGYAFDVITLGSGLLAGIAAAIAMIALLRWRRPAVVIAALAAAWFFPGADAAVHTLAGYSPADIWAVLLVAFASLACLGIATWWRPRAFGRWTVLLVAVALLLPMAEAGAFWYLRTN
jgi:serine/threonine protein kinase